MSQTSILESSGFLDRFLNNAKWNQVLLNIYQAQVTLQSFKYSLSVNQKEPTYWELRFTNNDLSKFDKLKKYAGDYGFVVPVKGTKHIKILKGEKMFKYKDLQ